MSKNYKTWTAILAFLPAIAVIIYIVAFVPFMMQMFRFQGQFMEEPDMSIFVRIFAAGIFMGVASLSALIFYLLHAVRDKTLTESERLMWILVLIFANVIAYPIYWYMRINKHSTAGTRDQDLSSQTVTR